MSDNRMTAYEIKTAIGEELEGAGTSNPYYVADLIEKLILELAQIPRREYGGD